jgi:hypothetical protein
MLRVRRGFHAKDCPVSRGRVCATGMCGNSLISIISVRPATELKGVSDSKPISVPYWAYSLGLSTSDTTKAG